MSLGQQGDRSRNRKPNHVEVAALNPRNPPRRVSLDGISPGLIQWFTTRDVLRDLGIIDAVERHLRDLQISDDLASRNNSKARENSVRTPAQQLQHPSRIGRIDGLAQYVTIANDAGIGAKNKERLI